MSQRCYSCGRESALGARLEHYAGCEVASAQRDSSEFGPITGADLDAAREPNPLYRKLRGGNNPQWFRLTMRSGTHPRCDNVIGDIRDQRTAYLIGSLMRALDENDHPEYSHFTVVPCTGGCE